MNVEDLIDILSTLPRGMTVMCRGPAGGFKEVEFVDEMQLVLDVNDTSTRMGPHEDYDLVEVVKPSLLDEHEVVECFVLK